MAVNQRLTTADELMAMPDDGQRHELVRGELRTMPPGGWEHGYESIEVAASLAPYVRRRGLGRVAGADTGFRLTTDPDTVRAPDLAFVRLDRLPAGADRRGYFPGAPDLAVEVISPNDLYTEVDEKVGEWLEHGCQMVLVVNPRRKTVAVHRPGQAVRILGMDDTLDGEDVVPGWTMPVRDIFDES
jgi:Uma2 family endonuclease